MRIIIVAGGTGGHIYPALALVEAIEKYEPSEFLFIGSKNRMEAKLIPELNYAYQAIDVQGMNGSVLNKFKSMGMIFKSIKQCKKIIKDFNPDIVVGFGNYISVPVILAAKQLKYKTMIHEQNSYPGKANLFLAKYVDLIVGSYSQNLNDFPKSKTKILGNPRAETALNHQLTPDFLNKYDLKNNLPLIVIMMGSLGSQTVNSIILEALPLLNNPQYQILMAIGKNNQDQLNNISLNYPNIKIVSYVDGLDALMACDLCVVRAGATTLAEVCSFKKPAIVIPSPYVPNDHQTKNALALGNGVLVINEGNLNPAFLAEQIENLIFDQDKLKNMQDNLAQLGLNQANTLIIQEIKSLIGEKNG